MAKFSKFLKSECGAITADWPVLAAAVLSLGTALAVSLCQTVS